jgi:hypothetical protein
MKHLLLFTVLVVFGFYMNQSKAQNLLPGGDMESGVDDWTGKFRKGSDGTISVTNDAVNGSQAMLIDVTTGSTDANPDLSHGQAESAVYKPEGFTDKSSYRLTAFMKANVAENEIKWKILPVNSDGSPQHIAGLQNEDNSFLHLTTEYKKYKWIASNVKPGFDQGFYLQLQVGLNIAKYFIDDLSVEKIEGIENAGFEDEQDFFGMITNVNTASGAEAEFTIDTENANTGNKALKANVTAVNDTVGLVTVITETRFYPEAGQKYEFSVYAKGMGENDSISLDINYYDQENSYLSMQSKMVKVTNEYQKYSMTFDADAPEMHSVRFRVGLAKQVSTIYLDDMEIAPSTGTAIRNEFGTNNSIKCYPNPANKALHISGIEMGGTIQIFSITGLVVKEMVVTNTPAVVDISNFENGVYLLRSGNNTTKFIKR